MPLVGGEAASTLPGGKPQQARTPGNARTPVLTPRPIPPVSGSTGATTTGGTQPTTPYGGVYPQPGSGAGIGTNPAGDIYSTISPDVRPLRDARVVILDSTQTLPANQNWVTSGPLNFAFTIQDVVIATDGIKATSNCRFGTTKSTVSDGPSADAAQNLILGASAQPTGSGKLTLPMAFAVTPIYGLNKYINDIGTRLWLEFTNNDIANRSTIAMFTIVIESGMESVP